MMRRGQYCVVGTIFCHQYTYLLFRIQQFELISVYFLTNRASEDVLLNESANA